MINKLLLKYFNRYIVTLRPMPDVITDTNRYYSSKVLDKAVDEYVKKRVNLKKAVCECSMLPSNDNTYACLEINLRNVSHMILKIWKWKSEYKALIKVLTKTGAGSILKIALLDDEFTTQFNLRGAASTSVNETLDGSVVVNDDLCIISWDASPHHYNDRKLKLLGEIENG